MKSHYELPAEPRPWPGPLFTAPGAAAAADQPLGPEPVCTTGPEAFALHEHREVWDAIPWVVAGTATPEQVRMVVDHANHCSYCDNEVAWQQKIHRGMQDTPPAIDSAALDAGLERLWARDRDVDATQLPAPRGVIGNEEVNAVMASVVAGRSKNKRWLLMALTVQAMATLVLGLQLAWDPKSDDIDPIPSAGLPQAILRMVPHGRTDMNTLRHLLNQHGLRIVGADEEANSLLLAPLGPEPIPASSAVALLENLRDEPGVMLVVPVVPQVNR